MFTFIFQIGIVPDRTVRVRSKDVTDAFRKARVKLDRQAERKGEEPPVAWHLALIRVEAKV